MRTSTKRAGRTALAVLAGSALTMGGLALPAFADVATPNVIRPTAGTTQVNVLGFNDFHGRILSADKFAGTVLDAKQGFSDNVVLSNGDAVGASIFESQVQQDQPTIDALNTLGVDSWTAGNHEFDRGADDYKNRISPATNGPDLAANVTKADGSQFLEPYAIVTTPAGVKVGIIGAVTDETPSLVSPAGIEGLTFGDPVEAVNKYAAQLSDGDASNGEADIIIASYHEGGPVSDDLSGDLSSAVFTHLVKDTSSKVNAIFNAHTHQTYSYEIAGPDGVVRPVVQAGSYAEKLGQIVFTVDAGNKVTKADVSVIKADTIPASVASDPKIASIQKIIDDAKAKADELGAPVVGSADNITRAYTGWTSTTVDPATGVVTGTHGGDDRGNASSLGDLVADSMLDAANGRAGHGPVDGGLINPGGLRADLDANKDGKVTVKEAAGVLPFANTLDVVTLTGADLTQALEQQWQPAGSSRSYLQLGLSSSITYTFDSTKPAGERITGVYVHGEKITDDQQLRLVMPSFLAAGGDNFTAIANGSKQDSGLTDLESFLDWFRGQSTTVKVDNIRQGVELQGLPASIEAGSSAPITLKQFDKASEGYVQNSKVAVEATVGGTQVALGTADITTPNTADVTLTVPADVPAGTYTATATIAPSGTVAQFELVVTSSTVPPVEAATVTTEKQNYTVAESVDGISFSGQHWTPGASINVDVTRPDGSVESLSDFATVAEDGTINGTLIQSEIDQNTGETIRDRIEWASGSYTLTVTEASVEGRSAEGAAAPLTASTSFTVGDLPAAGETTIPATQANTGGPLASTGADSNLLFGGIAAALALLAIGATLVVLRRRRGRLEQD